MTDREAQVISALMTACGPEVTRRSISLVMYALINEGKRATFENIQDEYKQLRATLRDIVVRIRPWMVDEGLLQEDIGVPSPDSTPCMKFLDEVKK